MGERGQAEKDFVRKSLLRAEVEITYERTMRETFISGEL